MPQDYTDIKTSGHEEVSILNGGKKSWLSAGYALEKGDHKITASKFRVKYNNKYDASYKDVRDAKRKRTNYALIDARPKAFLQAKRNIQKLNDLELSQHL